MSTFQFWNHIGNPIPDFTPIDFSTTPFLDAAPSKIGRPPIYYLISGLLTHYWSFHILAHLFSIRILNLLMAVACVAITIYCGLNQSKSDSRFAAASGLIMIFIPGFWYLCCTVNTEAWSALLTAVGLLFLSKFSGHSMRVHALLWIWFFMTLMTHWRSILISLPIVLFLEIKTIRLKSAKPLIKHKAIRVTFILLLACFIFLSIQYLGTNLNLMNREILNAWSGINHLFQIPTPSLGVLKALFVTFFAGFGWLTVPVPGSAYLLFLGAFLVMGVITVTSLLRTPKSISQSLFLLGSIILISMFATYIRGIAQASAVQGRYLYPVVPIIAYFITRSLAALQTASIVKRFALPVLLNLFLIPGDLIATLQGWYPHYHMNSLDKNPELKAMASLKWVKPDNTRYFFDIGMPSTRPFMTSGWYPDENAVHVWFRHKATLRVPLLDSHDYSFQIQILPYLPAEIPPRTLRVFLDEQQVYESRPETGWSLIQFSGKPAGRSSFVDLSLVSDSADSPLSLGESDDRRVISFAVDWIQIQGRDDQDPILSKGILATSSRGLELFVPNSQGFEIRPETNQFIRIVSQQGEPFPISRQNPLWIANKPTNVRSLEILTSYKTIRDMETSMIRHASEGLYGYWHSIHVQLGIVCSYLASVIMAFAFVIFRFGRALYDPINP